jgi:hypothetical protein
LQLFLVAKMKLKVYFLLNFNGLENFSDIGF